MIEPKRTVTVEPVNPSNPSFGPDPLAFENSVRPCWSIDKDQRSAFDRTVNGHGWPPCRFAINSRDYLRAARAANRWSTARTFPGSEAGCLPQAKTLCWVDFYTGI